jgi:hypothetical protein
VGGLIPEDLGLSNGISNLAGLDLKGTIIAMGPDAAGDLSEYSNG